MKNLMSNKTYDTLKYIAQIVLPALATLYTGLAMIWGLPYAKDTFYKKVTDHFTNLISKASEDLQKELDTVQSLSAELNIETYEFDVGDFVGGIDPLTNKPFKSVVVKKIAKIDSFKAEVSYEIG